MTTAIILAAGQGTRMKSPFPKVLHELCGRPMIGHVVGATLDAGIDEVIVVVGHGREAVSAYLRDAFGARVKTAVQAEQRGTGHAVSCALPQLGASEERVLVLCGDTPLLEGAELRALDGALTPGRDLALLTMVVDDPTGYGRVLRRADGEVLGIREHADASPEERAIREVNPAVYAVRAPFLRRALGELRPDNAQGELYFTDVVARAAAEGVAGAVRSRDPSSLVGINDRAQLAAAEVRLHERIADGHRRAGATIRVGARVDADVRVEPDATIEAFCVLRGKTVVGAGARVDVGCVLTDVVVAPGAVLKPYTVAASSRVGRGAQVGPFSHLRPESTLEDEAHVGNFVETKKTILRKGAKANHLAYLGDGDVGEGANVGAGTIFCNYDGFRKHRTVIGRGAFVGSDSQLVAPVTIGDGAYVATGTTVTKDVPPDGLAISRTRQENKEGYAPRLRARLQAAAKKAT